VSRPSQKASILDAALACFAERGFDATRVKHIADRAGVAESAMYRHFPSKEAIAQDLYAGFVDRYAERLVRLAGSPGSSEERLRGVVRLVLETYRSEPAAFTFVVINTSYRLPKLPAGTTYPLDVIESIVARAQQDMTLRPGQSNLLAAILLGVVLQPIVLATLGSQGALDLLDTHEHDLIIEAAALAAISA